MEEASSKHFEIQRYFLEYFSRNKTSPSGWYNNDTLGHNPVRNQRMDWWISMRFPLQIDMSCLPYIDKGKPVGSWFGQMVRKIQDRYISSRNRFYHLYRSVAFTEKQPPKSETSIKDSVLLMLHQRYTNFRLEQQEYLFRCSVAPGNFPLERLIYFPSGLSGNFW